VKINAKMRVDLTTEFLDFQAKYLNESDYGLNLWEKYLIVTSQCRFSNEKDFPVSFTITDVVLKFGEPKTPGKRERSSKPKEELKRVEFEWVDILVMEPKEAFRGYEPVIIESGGKLELPLYIFTKRSYEPYETFRFLELDIKMNIEAIHPETGETLGTKDKHMAYRGVLSGAGELAYGGHATFRRKPLDMHITDQVVDDPEERPAGFDFAGDREGSQIDYDWRIAVFTGFDHLPDETVLQRFVGFLKGNPDIKVVLQGSAKDLQTLTMEMTKQNIDIERFIFRPDELVSGYLLIRPVVR
jgi:hypothetical protein